MAGDVLAIETIYNFYKNNLDFNVQNPIKLEKTFNQLTLELS